jgi:predicted porin
MFNLGDFSMKKTLVALAAVAAVSAFAQSSVTIYGRVDMGVQKDPGTGLRLNASNGTSRIGFRGVEDLGGGMRATFDLQHRFNAEAGKPDGTLGGRVFWQGNSFVGLGGGWGDIHVGRRLTAYRNVDNIGDSFGVERVGSISAGTVVADKANNGDGSGLGRTDQVYYESPNLGGFKAAVSIGLKQQDSAVTGAALAPAPAANGTLFSTALWYGNGPLLVGFGYEQNREKDKGYTLGGQYDFGVARAFLGYVSTDPVGAVKATKNIQIGATAPVGPVVLKVGFLRTSPPVGANTSKIGLGLDYTLSKRTKIYSNYGKPKNVGGSFDLGVQHNF